MSGTPDDWLEELPGKLRKTKLKHDGWLRVAELPPLPCRGGGAVGAECLEVFFALQAKAKTIAPVESVVPLLERIDRDGSGDFALALLEQWRGSGEAAADRWVLTLSGLLGDQRTIRVLDGALKPWCEASRGKLAEYAVQAMSLQGTDAALLALDQAANRFRTRYRNVGTAARKAFAAAADVRGISTDDLADMVVPDLGFDAEGRQEFVWEGGAVTAVLGADFKLQWSPAAGKVQRSLPASTPAEVKAASKQLGKDVRDVAKAQTLRLEPCLVRQRCWPPARFCELFLTQPLLRPFGQRLVFGAYDGGGVLLQTLRVYPNGLLADHDGGLVELDAPVQEVGIVHPLEVDGATLSAWRAHFERFQIAQPFPQLERSVVRLDPAHHNRRQIADVDGATLSAMTFRGRAEKRGWVRGSVVDAGGIAGYWKHFPAAGVDVLLPLDGMFIGAGPEYEVTLGTAMFLRAGSVLTGSYVYDEPADSSDPRVLPFGEVPAIVYSESLGDLLAITGRA